MRQLLLADTNDRITRRGIHDRVSAYQHETYAVLENGVLTEVSKCRFYHKRNEVALKSASGPKETYLPPECDPKPPQGNEGIIRTNVEEKF